MVASINLPGSSHFDYFVGTKKACEEWLEKKIKQAGIFHVSPVQIKPNKAWRKERYRDGSPVIPEVYGK